MRYQPRLDQLFLNCLFELERGDAGHVNSIVDQRERYVPGAADADVARKLGNVKYLDMNNVAGSNRNIGEDRLRSVGKLLDPVVRLLRGFFLLLAIRGREAGKSQSEPNEPN